MGICSAWNTEVKAGREKMDEKGIDGTQRAAPTP